MMRTIVALIVLVACTTWVLSYRSARASIHVLADQLGRQSMLSIEDHLANYLSVPPLVNSTNDSLLRYRNSRAGRQEGLLATFASELKEFPGLGSVAFASSAGDYVGMSRGTVGLSLAAGISDASTVHYLTAFKVDDRFRPTERVAQTGKVYDPRTRPWYRSAIEAGRSTWTPVYLWTSGEVGIDSVVPVTSEKGDIVGVLDASITLKGIGSFLKEFRPTKNSEAYIIDNSGRLVASSTDTASYRVTNGSLERIRAAESTDPILRAVGLGLPDRRGFTTTIDHRRSLVRLAGFRRTPGVRWTIAVVIPEADFAQNIYSDMRTTAFVLGGLLLASLLVASLLARRITIPLEKLNVLTRSVAAGDLSGQISVYGRDEIAQLAASFNRMEEALEESFASVAKSEERYRAIFHRSAVSLWEVDIRELRRELDRLRDAGNRDLETYTEEHPGFILKAMDLAKVVNVNEQTLRLFEAKSREELLGPFRNTFAPETFEHFLPAAIGRAERGKEHGLETTVTTRSGRLLNVIIYFNIPALDDTFQNMLVSVIDVTSKTIAERERAHMEEQLLQAQKMESIGQLAGGIAHDINNLLTPILGYGKICLGEVSTESRDNVKILLGSADRIRELTQKLLAFSRNQRLAKRVVDLRTVVDDFALLLRATLGRSIELSIEAPPTLEAVKVDVGQIDQVLMNLAVNAKHAMPQGGQFKLTLAEVIIDEVWTQSRGGLRPGDYISLTVSDTGTGMDETTRQRVFEPFFTTKESDEGTGLGLSTVYGIVRQHGGHIEVDSRPDWGTVFTIYLPSVLATTREKEEIL